MKAEDMRDAVDVSGLPSYVFSNQSPMWWGTLGMIAIECTVFALLILSYFYLASLATTWPMYAPPPDLLWGTLNTVLLLVSLWPAHMAKKAGKAMDIRCIRLWLAVSVAAGLAFIVIRVLEFPALNTRWDSSAYGSVIWTLLGFHTAHLATDVFDTALLLLLFHKGPLDGKRFVDVAENADYWYFVVWVWIPIYLTIYWGARPL